MFKIISLNVRGLGTDDKVDWVRELGVTEDPIVFGLQETKLKEVDEKFVRRLWNEDDLGFAQVNTIGSSGGLITMLNASIFTGIHAVGEVDFLAVVGKWNDVEGSFVGSSVDDFLNLTGIGSTKLRFYWQAVIWTSLYLIWKARNNKFFQVKQMLAANLVFEIQLAFFFWVSHRCNSFEYSWIDWCNGSAFLI
ncbi:hypothetical protein CTI12_AA488250 [Artemisia annua]|uniref:RNA-directed DNA polymerase, eukaryota, Reverse transcriptase zinc-binding domain protein n=1 Tax=Artemisia annua TaxID=35608 RepID=A0A2U1LJR1_ARTAN|nr:hypothetical protein CTI12_AA488250 [Artemisia annua]